MLKIGQRQWGVLWMIAPMLVTSAAGSVLDAGTAGSLEVDQAPGAMEGHEGQVAARSRHLAAAATRENPEQIERIDESVFAPGDGGGGAKYVGLCCAKCGGNMPLNIPGGGVPETHEWRVKLSQSFMEMPGLRDGTEDVSTSEALQDFRAVPTEMDMRMTSLALGYSLHDDLFAGAMLMYMDSDMPMERRDGSTFEMSSEGIADTMVMIKYRLYYDDPFIPTSQLSLLLGASLPTGSIDEEDEGMLLPFSMQLGSGTVDPVVGLLYQGSSTPWWWGANLTHTNRLYDNDEGYRLGDETRYDVYLMRQLRYDTVAELQVNGRAWGRINRERDEARRRGVGHVMGDPAAAFMTPLWDPDNYGGHTVRATAGLQWQPAPLHILNLQLSYPLHQDLNGPQMETGLSLRLAWYFEWPTARSRRAGMSPFEGLAGF